jgi:hypothetical protein
MAVAKELGGITQAKIVMPIIKDTGGDTIGSPLNEPDVSKPITEQPALAPVIPLLPLPLTIPPSPTVRSPFRTFTVLIALYLTVFIAALDQTIIATAIPTITTSLNSASGYTWIGGAYLIANAAAGPIWTKLSDIWGRKPLLLVSVAWFFGASVVCARAGSMKILIVGR